MGEQTYQYKAVVSHTNNGSRDAVVDLFTNQMDANEQIRMLMTEHPDVEPMDYSTETVEKEGNLLVDVETEEEYVDQTGFGTSEWNRLHRKMEQ